MSQLERRLELHTILCEILGSEHVYFQPPESVKMVYPAIVYGIDDVGLNHANDGVYLSRRRYQVTVIDTDPDSELPGEMLKLSACRFNRRYIADNLYHDVFTLYY